MSAPGLSEREVALMTDVLRRHPEVTSVSLFGSRAKGTHTHCSDVDLAVWGDVDDVRAEALAAEFDDLPLPYRFDVKPFATIRLQALRDHIERIGIPLYAAPRALR